MNFEYYCNTRMVMGVGKSKEVALILADIVEPHSTIMIVSDPGVKKQD